jgi:hypothetical protein
MHFTLLVGDYSRQNFNHPGPAYLYVQAFGQWLFFYWLHVVPTAWNSHVIAVFILSSATMALAVLVVYGWTGSLRGSAACLAVILLFAVVHPDVLSNDWMSYMYIPTYVIFLIAAASVMAGHTHDAWIFVLTGWFLIHGQASFLLFVPLISLAVLAALVWTHRRTPVMALRRFLRDQRRVWIPVLAISALFTLPIAVNLCLHWPGDFVKYVAYGRSSRAGGHTPVQVLRFALWYWWPHPHAWLVALLLGGAALGVTLGLARGPVRRFLLALVAVDVVSSAVLCVYAAVGVDFLDQYYIGYFYWSAPMVAVLVIAVGVTQALGARAGTALAAAGAVAALAVLTTVPGLRTSIQRTGPGMPQAVDRAAALAHGRTIVLTIEHGTWPDTVGFLVQAERTNVRACVDQPWWTFMMTTQFICTPDQAAHGARFWFDTQQPPAPKPVLFTFDTTEVAARAP